MGSSIDRTKDTIAGILVDLDAAGLLRPSVVVVTSDHDEEFFECGRSPSDHGPPAPAREWMRSGFRLVGRFPTTANPTGPDMLWELPPLDRGPCPTGFFDPPSPARPSS